MKAWPTKQPSEILDYAFDFAAALGDGEAIATKTVTVAGVTLDASSILNSTVVARLSGGTAGTIARVDCTIVTDASPARTFAETAVLPIGGSPLALAEAKAHLHVDHDLEDALIEALVSAAVDQVERDTDLLLTPRVIRQTAAGFPCGDRPLKLHRGPVSEVVAIAYDPADGSAAAELDEYRLVEGIGAALLPDYGASWPDARSDGTASVRIDLVAGFEPEELAARPGLVQAAKYLLGHWFANREAVATGTAAELPLGYRALIGPHRRVVVG